MTSPAAWFDTLAIVAELGELLGGVTRAETHIFAYLACLLSLYEGNATASWDYEYVNTPESIPFSADLHDAIEQFVRAGVVDESAGVLKLTERGRAEYEFVSSLFQNASRKEFIRGACSSALAMQPNAIKEALREEPELLSASHLRRSRTLLAGPGVESLYEHFEALRTVFKGRHDDLLSLAVVWLTYLLRKRGAEA